VNHLNSQKCIGDNIINSKNCLNCFNVTKGEDSLYIWDGYDVKDAADINNVTEIETGYNVMSTGLRCI